MIVIRLILSILIFLPLLLLHQKGRKDKEWETDSACQRFPLCVFCPKNR